MAGKPLLPVTPPVQRKLVSESNDKTMSALAPRLAAELYGLNILEENVEDTETNVTRFVVLSREAKIPPRPVADEVVVTTFVFRVRNIPAALYKAMGGFATNGVNMTKLESYQIGGKFFATQFYADIQGHPDEPPVARAMEELGFFSKELRILGVYPAHPFRLAQNGSHAKRPRAEKGRYRPQSSQSRISRCAMAPGGGADASASPSSCQHCLSLGAVEPAAILKLIGVAGDVQALASA
jgi:hypothetical protein